MAVLLWLSPYLILFFGWRHAFRYPHLTPANRNAIATACAAASIAVVVLGLVASWQIIREGGFHAWAWAWPQATVALLAGLAGAVGGWSGCIAWLALRCLRRGWGSPGSPTFMQVALAWAGLVFLAVGLTEGLNVLAANLPEKAP